MSNPPKRKGTAYETELVRALSDVVDWPEDPRTSPGTPWDLECPGEGTIEVLATRPDRGQTLITMNLEDFRKVWKAYNLFGKAGLRVECKRYARFALHTIFEAKFGGKHARG